MQLTKQAFLLTVLVVAAHTAWAQQGQLAPGSTQRVQGTIHADTGKGVVELTSLATTLPENLGTQTAARLQSAEGRAAIQQGDARAKAATGQGVTASSVQDIANRYAGKTVYTSSMRHFPRLKSYILTLEGSVTKGPRISLSMNLDEKSLAESDAGITFYPDSADSFNDFRSGKKSTVTVKIDKIERVGDKVYAMSGSFTAKDLQPGALSKDLKGQTLPVVQGRFAFTEVPVR